MNLIYKCCEINRAQLRIDTTTSDTRYKEDCCQFYKALYFDSSFVTDLIHFYSVSFPSCVENIIRDEGGDMNMLIFELSKYLMFVDVFVQHNDLNFCPPLKSHEFLIKLSDLCSNLPYNSGKIPFKIVSIIRTLWKIADSSKDEIVFDFNLILSVLKRLLMNDPQTAAASFDAINQLLLKCPEKWPFLLETNVLFEAFEMYANTDERYFKDKISLPLYLVLTLLRNFELPHQYHLKLFTVCLKFISGQHFNPRLLSTEAIANGLLNKSGVDIFLSIPGSVETVIRAHLMNSELQIKNLYLIDTILFSAGNEDFYTIFNNFNILENISNNIFKYQKYCDFLGPVLRFMTNFMPKIWMGLYLTMYSQTISNVKNQKPLIYRIIDISNISTSKNRQNSCVCISHFLLCANYEIKMEVAAQGGFETIVSLLPNMQSRTQKLIPMLRTIESLFYLDNLFYEIAQSHNLDLALIEIADAEIETENKECAEIIEKLLNLIYVYNTNSNDQNYE